MKVYNQNKSNSFGADCTIFSMLQIIGIKYDVWIPYSNANKVVDYFVKVGLLLTWGASFNLIYPAMAKVVEWKTGLKLNTVKHYITSDVFAANIDKGIAYGIGLKYGNAPYLRAVARGVIMKSDIDQIAKAKGGFGHNNVFGAGSQYGQSIFEIYKGKEVDCAIDVLRYGVRKGVFYAPARTFEFDDKLIEKWLLLFKNKDPIIQKDVSTFSKKEQKAIIRASSLRNFQK